ncbi:MFS transporter [Amorphoplanes nipponensis]|uniref:MFS transporter n=1 Tax=Actinoplanes nipponensis TaxID=135950 RepID=A0A919JLP2_9ACTN|nr:MFS transporter [Actinoplanes nipponensis]GIE49089.1 MFS transporter [Actinoplanes nipponensis]
MSETIRPAPAGEPTTSSAGRRAGPAQLALLLAGSCLAVLGAVLIAPVLPQMTDHFAGVAGADVLVPVVLTVPALVIGLAAPFAGFVVDALDRKRLLIVAMVLYSVFGTAPLYLQSLGAIIGSRVLVGICEAAIMTCCTTLIADYWSGPRRSRYLGLQTLTASVSAAVFLGVGGALGAAGWRTPFWLYLVAALLALPMARLLWQPERGPAAPAPAGRRLPAVPWRELLAPCLVTLAGGIIFYALIVELSFVLDEAGVGSTATIGALSALMSVATAAGSLAFARLSGQSPRRLLPVALGVSAAGLAIVAASGAVPVITVGAVLTGAGTGLLLPTLLTWAINRLSFAQRGRGTGLWTGALFIGEFLCPLLIAGLGAAAGGLRPALAILAGLAAALAVVTLMVVPRGAAPLDITHG